MNSLNYWDDYGKNILSSYGILNISLDMPLWLHVCSFALQFPMLCYESIGPSAPLRHFYKLIILLLIEHYHMYFFFSKVILGNSNMQIFCFFLFLVMLFNKHAHAHMYVLVVCVCVCSCAVCDLLVRAQVQFCGCSFTFRNCGSWYVCVTYRQKCCLLLLCNCNQ